LPVVMPALLRLHYLQVGDVFHCHKICEQFRAANPYPSTLLVEVEPSAGRDC
jgi:hypothetical protein